MSDPWKDFLKELEGHFLRFKEDIRDHLERVLSDIPTPPSAAILAASTSGLLENTVQNEEKNEINAGMEQDGESQNEIYENNQAASEYSSNGNTSANTNDSANTDMKIVEDWLQMLEYQKDDESLNENVEIVQYALKNIVNALDSNEVATRHLESYETMHQENTNQEESHDTILNERQVEDAVNCVDVDNPKKCSTNISLKRGASEQLPQDSITEGLKKARLEKQEVLPDVEFDTAAQSHESTDDNASNETLPPPTPQFVGTRYDLEIHGHYFEWQATGPFRMQANRISFWPPPSDEPLEPGNQQKKYVLSISETSDANTGAETIRLEMQGIVYLTIVPRRGVHLKDFVIYATNAGQLDVEFPAEEVKPTKSEKGDH